VDEVEVVRSARARRWRLEVPWGAPVRLTVPERTSDRTIRRVLAERRDWIEEQRSLQVPRLGLDPARVDEHEARRAAKELVSAIADEEAAALAVSFRQIRIGGQRTLWGSCSPAGTLSFNWRLALAPLAVLDYVVVHELCHLREANHSRRFWSLVESRRPGWREQRTWLRENGQELLAFTPRGITAEAPAH
jgi:predicted metal-dependent hydrolase